MNEIKLLLAGMILMFWFFSLYSCYGISDKEQPEFALILWFFLAGILFEFLIK